MISLTSYIQEWKQSIWDINFFQEFKIRHGIWRNKSWDNRWEQRRHSKVVLHVYVMRFRKLFFFFTRLFSLTPSSCQLLVPRVGHKCFFTLKEDNFHLNLVFIWVQHFLSITFAFLACISTLFCSSWNHHSTTTSPQDLVWCKGEQFYVLKGPFKGLAYIAPLGLWIVPWLPQGLHTNIENRFLRDKWT